MINLFWLKIDICHTIWIINCENSLLLCLTYGYAASILFFLFCKLLRNISNFLFYRTDIDKLLCVTILINNMWPI